MQVYVLYGLTVEAAAAVLAIDAYTHTYIHTNIHTYRTD